MSPAFPTSRQEPSGASGDQRLCRLVTWHSDRRLSLHSEAYTAEPVLPACDRTRCLASAVRRPGASKADHQQCDLVRPLPSRHPDHLHLADHLPFPAFNALSGCHPDQRFSEVRDQPSQRPRSEEHTSELQSLMRTSYADFCLKKKNII